jgi:molybdate transport system ATP-binding protein
LLGLEPLLSRSPRALSGGETSRVALGRALLASPEILLLDEPLAALDNARRAEILPYLERLRDDAKLPMLYVSHAVEEVARLAQEVVMIESGRVVAEGSVFEVLTSLDFAQRAGTAPVGAVIEAVVGTPRTDGLTMLTFGDGVLYVPSLSQPAGTRLRLRIAAQDIMLALEEPRAVSANNVLPARVMAVRNADVAHADVQLALGATRLIARITRASAERLVLTEGMAVFAVVKSVTIDPRMLPRL